MERNQQLKFYTKNNDKILFPAGAGFNRLYIQFFNLNSVDNKNLLILNSGINAIYVFEIQSNLQYTFYKYIQFDFEISWFYIDDFNQDSNHDILIIKNDQLYVCQLIKDEYQFSDFTMIKDSLNTSIQSEFGNLPIIYDWDKDNYSDLFLTTQSDGRVIYYQNQSNSNEIKFHLRSLQFAEIQVKALAKNSFKKHGRSSFYFADLDANSMPEILWGDQFQNYFYLLTNHGSIQTPKYVISDSQFSFRNSLHSDRTYNVFIMFDYDKNGSNDFFILNQSSLTNNFHHYRSTSHWDSLELITKNFISTIDFGFDSHIDFYDIDSDENQDFIISTGFNDLNVFELNFFKKQSDGSFKEFQFNKTISWPWASSFLVGQDFQILDLNRDSKWDIVYINQNNQLFVAYNNGTSLNPLFNSQELLLENLGYATFFHIFDKDEDGDFDLFSINNASFKSSLFLTNHTLFDRKIESGSLNLNLNNPSYISFDYLGASRFLALVKELIGISIETRFLNFQVDTNSVTQWNSDLQIPSIGNSPTLSIEKLENDSIKHLFFGSANGGFIHLSKTFLDSNTTSSSDYQILAYPNPHKGVQFIKRQKSHLNVNLQIFNILGQNCSQLINLSYFSDSFRIHFDSSLANGLYIIIIESNKETYHFKSLLLR